ncbi:hypothetical protein DER45DRAFT_598058 [Fusarium avenaceum]|nr:hypothetical protein DER45DRAFT_598058 [Fusarium avenaceum]
MRSTFLSLALLPFYAIAQDPAIPDAAPTTTTSDAFIAPAVDVSTDVGVEQQPTTTDAIVVPETTPEVIPEVPETPTEAPVVQDTTTQQPIIQDTTTQLPVPVQDTTTQQPIIQDTTTQLPVPVQDTTTELLPPVVNTTTGLAPVIDTTTQPINETPGPETTQDVAETTGTELPVIPDTTTQLPVIQDTTTQAPIIQDTTTDVPVIPDTTTELPVIQDTTTQLPVIQDTTTDLPVPQDTTTDVPVVQDTTTEVPPPAETTTQQAPIPETTTAAQQPAETTQAQEPQPTTKAEENEPKTTEKNEDDPVITQAPVPTTAPPEATSSVSSVSSQVAALIPVINKWKDDPESLKDQTNKEVEDTRDDIIAVIVLLGGKPDVGCSNKKRGLLGAIGDVINKLACMAKDLTEISGGIIAGNVPAVTGVIPGVQSSNNELTEEENDDDDDDKTEEKSEEESTKQEESTKEESTTQAPTTTEAPTSTEESTTTTEATTTGEYLPCGSDTCGGGDACPMNAGPLSGAQMAVQATGPSDCDDIPTTTTEGDLPTAPGNFGGFSVTDPTARPESQPVRRSDSLKKHSIYAGSDSQHAKRSIYARFADDTSPNPNYVSQLTPAWVSQVGDTSGQWFDFPQAGVAAAGVNGIYGCTAVIIVSEKGVYLSHIWENPVFIDIDWNNTPDDQFDRVAFQALRDGTVNAQSVVGLIGTDANPGPLNAIFSPKVFVLTPFTNQFFDPTGVTTTLRYQDRAQNLANNLARVIPGSGGQGYLLGYTRTNQALSTAQNGYAGRAIVEVDMLERVLTTPNAPQGSLGLAVARWRLWVEDQIVTSQEFWIPDYNLRKREDNPNQECLIIGDSTATSAGPTSEATSAVETTEAKTEETTKAEETTSAVETTKAEETTKVEETTTAAEETTPKETSVETTPNVPTTADETTTKPPTTLRTSFITTTSAPDTTAAAETTTTGDSYTGPYYCANKGGPNVATPHCQCSTTTEGQSFYTTAPLISGQCHYYHSYPASVTLAPTEAPAPPEPTPFTTTKDDGAILAYPDQTVVVGNYPGGSYTRVEGSGDASTIRPADPVETDANNKGAGPCRSIDDACDRAIGNFKDDVIYTEFASYYARFNSGILVALTFGQAGCVVEFDCDDWSVGGLNGKQIKDAYQGLKDNNGVSKCGSGYYSNTCRVTANYCTNCNERHQKID